MQTWQVFELEDEEVQEGAILGTVTWSPEGEWLSFLRFRYGYDHQAAEPLIAKADGSGDVVHLLDSYAPFMWDELPWSPDGSQLLYVTTESRADCIGPAVCDSLWVTSADGIIRRALLPLTFGLGAGPPQWSPDGQWIVFAGVRNFEREDPLYSLWLVKNDGTALLRLTDSFPNSNDSDPLWTPDGRHIVFQKGLNSVLQGIWVLNLIDGSLRQLYPEAVESFAVR